MQGDILVYPGELRPFVFHKGRQNINYVWFYCSDVQSMGKNLGKKIMLLYIRRYFSYLIFEKPDNVSVFKFGAVDHEALQCN